MSVSLLGSERFCVPIILVFCSEVQLGFLERVWSLPVSLLLICEAILEHFSLKKITLPLPSRPS